MQMASSMRGHREGEGRQPGSEENVEGPRRPRMGDSPFRGGETSPSQEAAIVVVVGS